MAINPVEVGSSGSGICIRKIEPARWAMEQERALCLDDLRGGKTDSLSRLLILAAMIQKDR